jgi:6-phosphogluconolactonase
MLDKNNRFAFANDLGIDKVMIYQFDDKTGKLKPNAAQAFYQTKAGAGPRHFAFHPNGKFAFVINELDMTISSLAYDGETGNAQRNSNRADFARRIFPGANTCADIHVSPNGKFLYGSNRGHDSIVSYKIDEKTGQARIHRTRFDRRQNAAQFCDRPDRAISAGGKSKFRFDRRFSD